MGKLLEAREKRKTSGAIEKLLQLQPRRARIERNGQISDVDLVSVVAGDIVRLVEEAQGSKAQIAFPGYLSLTFWQSV